MEDNHDMLESMDDDDINEIESIIPELTISVQKARFNEALILEESAKNGGPATGNEAIINLMQYCNVGIRELSRRANVPRSKLQKMINGEKNIPPETFTAICEVFEEKSPHLFGK